VRDGKHTEIKTDDITGDLTDSSLNFEGKDFDCVFHLASHTPLEKNSKVLENVNLNGTKNLFEAINGRQSQSYTFQVWEYLVIRMSK
jgi:nucleoside-diphosphate-sugar epimerase